MRNSAERCVELLARCLPRGLASELVSDFVSVKADIVSTSLRSGSMGHFVESVVQALQYLEDGEYESKPSVDSYLRGVESRNNLDDGLRICVARTARAMYAIRSKRGVVHKSTIKSNVPDLAFAFAASQWIMSELIRQIGSTSMMEANKLISWVQAPVHPLIDEIEGKAVVLADMSVRDEVALMLGAGYPESVTRSELVESLDLRSEGSIDRALSALIGDRLATRLTPGTYCLTRLGVTYVESVIDEFGSSEMVPAIAR